MNCRIDIIWDPDAAVWVATSSDVSGLVLESGSLDALLERVRYAVPELSELNGEKQSTYFLSYNIKKEDQVAVNG